MSSFVSNTISGGISFSGLGSGTDFTEMIAQLKSVEEIPKTRMTIWKSEWEYRTAAMEEVLTVMQEARGLMRDFDSISKMMDVKVDSSEKEVATATINTGSELTEGNYSIDVKQLATASLFSTIKHFDKKNSIINDSDATQEFSYTYKGTSRTIDCPPGTTLEQLLLRINNDAENPGVRASLIKDGDQYMFQVQGKNTGVDSELSISSTLDGFDNNHLFTAENVSINSGITTGFSVFHEGKSLKMDIEGGMTAGEFVEKFNTNSDNPGLTAYLARDGADYTIKFKDKSSGYEVNPPTSTSISALGAQTGVATTTQEINDTGTVQNYTYSYLGKNYSVPVADGQNLEDLRDSINNSTDAQANGVTAYIDPDPTIAGATGPFTIKMRKEDAIFNDSGVDQTVKYTLDGVTADEFEFVVKPGTTMKEYVEQFNAHAKANGADVRVKLDETDDGGSPPVVTGTLNYTDATGGVRPSTSIDWNGTGTGIDTANGADTLITMEHDGGAASILEGLGAKTNVSGKDTIVNAGSNPEAYSVTFDGGPAPATDITMTMDPVLAGTDIEQFVIDFNDDNATHASGIKAVLIKGASGYSLGFVDAAGDPIKPKSVTTNMESLKSSGDNWYEQKAQDAEFSVNGWDKVLTSSSNKLDEVIDGMTITIKSEGKTQFSIASDSSKLQENIHAIVETLNLVKGTILKLQEVDTDKPTGGPDDEDLSSQFTWQSGSALTGNYGVQMLLSGFSQITSGSAIGFVGMNSVEDTLNDTFTALSQLGISTATNPADDDFGLLRIDAELLDEAIRKDADGVASLFSAKRTASTNSTDFTVASTGTVAKAGTYDVEYEVDDAGSVTDVWINGVRALNDPAYPGRFTVADNNNDAAGIAVQFNTSGLAPTTGSGPHKGEIRVKQGKVNEMASFLDDELRRTSVTGETQGTLPTIISNYAEISENIQLKIDRETKRIEIWERRTKLKFARLDTLLGQQNALLQSMSSMLPPMR